jgi:general secretion pathway protein A
MYLQFYGLRELPFELTPNPRFLFMTPRHREALSNLQFGLSAGKPLTLLIGEAGTGKTTLLKAALESDVCRNVRTIHINNPALTRGEFVDILARGFSLSDEAARSKSALLRELERVLMEARAHGEMVALIVDEAQALSDELLEEVRLLANIETAEEKLLPLVLAGQPELAARLNETNLRQLKQRVSLRCEITSLDLSEAAAYIASRIRAAGGEPHRLFSRQAIVLIHERSRGVPRTISVICDNALLTGFALSTRPVTRDIVAEVCRDFDLGDLESRHRRLSSTERAQPAPVLSASGPATRDVPAVPPPEAVDEGATFSNSGGRKRFTLFGR